MTSASGIRESIQDLVSPGSMTLDDIVDELGDEYGKRDVQLELVEMIDDGELEEHPSFDDVYRIP